MIKAEIKKDSSNWGILGNEKIISSLKNVISNKLINHAYLFVGPNKIGKKKASISFAKSMLCERGDMCNSCKSCLEIDQNKNPDFNILDKGNKKIKIDDIRKIQHNSSLKSYGKSKIFIIDGIDKFTVEAGNSLLKILEEPKGNAKFILTAESIENILPTIVSRCVVYKFNLVAEDTILEYLEEEYKGEDNKEIARLSFGRPELAVEMNINNEIILEKKETEKEIIEIINEKTNKSIGMMGEWVHHEESKVDKLEILMQWFRDILMYKLGNEDNIISLHNIEDIYQKYSNEYSIKNINEIISKIIRAKELISQNVNRKLILENLAFKIKNE